MLLEIVETLYLGLRQIDISYQCMRLIAFSVPDAQVFTL